MNFSRKSLVVSLVMAWVSGIQAAHAAPSLLDRLEASVNSTPIFKSDIERFRKAERLRAQLDPLYSGTTLATQGARASDAEITDFLINEKIINQIFPVTDPEVEQEINSIQANNRIDRASLKGALTQQGFSFEDYFELIRSSASKRNLIDRDIRTKVSITDNDVKNYYYNNYAKTAGARRSYKLKIIVVSAKNFKTASAAKDSAMRAQKAIKDGEAFDEVARRFSDDATASSGGDLGTLTEDQMSPSIREHLKGLKIGQVSDLFGSPSTAYYLLKLEDVSSDEGARLEKATEEIRNQLLASEFQHQIQLWIERQRQKAFIHRAGEPSVNGLPVQP